MQVLNVGGATAIIEHEGVRMLCDPWLDEGIFHGSWHHWPSANVTISDLGKLDYIYISHIHEDHCSAGTIKHLDRNAELIIAEKNPNFVMNFLKVHNFDFKKVHIVKPMTPYKLRDNLTVDIVTDNPADPPGYLINSGLVLKWGDKTIYNANDCAPYDGSIEYINKTYGEVDFAMIPYATGSSYPSCFSNLSENEKMAEKQRLYGFGMEKFLKATRELKPKYIMPFADQYVIVGSRHELNKYMPHPSCPGAVKKHFDSLDTDTQLVLLNSGQRWNMDDEVKSPNDDYVYFSDEQRNEYAEKHKESVYDYQLFDLNRTVALPRMLKICRDRLWEAQQRLGRTPDFNFYLRITDWEQDYEIPLSKNEINPIENYEPQTPYLTVSVPATLLYMMITGHISWNIADAALFIDYHRDPNTYDPEIHSMWNYFRI